MEPSLHAQICDLLGTDPDAPGGDNISQRPTVAQARERCRPGHIMPCQRDHRALIVVVLDDGRRFTAPDSCPHDGGLLSDGFVDGDRLVCARHGWEFELPQGTCPGRPHVRIEVDDT